MEYAVLGGPKDGPTLQLDHERFAYAGKFVTGRTGKAVAREDDSVVAAASFDHDRTDPSTVRIRYVTVRTDRRGRGIGASLLTYLAESLLAGERPGLQTEADRVVIAVNNAFAYEAAYKAGFSYTGEQTGLEELVLARPEDRRGESYRRGVEVLGERENLGEAERAFLEERSESDPPPTVSTPRDA